jgi:hypothetical protein
MYTLARQAGDYAPRTHFVDLFINDGQSTPGNLTAQYRGVYIFMESVKQGRARVNIQSNNGQTEGAFIVMQDKAADDDFIVPSRCPCNILRYPKDPSAAQVSFVSRVINTLCDTQTAVSKVINLTTWSHVWIHEQFSVNTDSFGRN